MRKSIARFVDSMGRGMTAAPKSLGTFAARAISKQGADAAAQGSELHGKRASQDPPIFGYVDHLCDGQLQGWVIAPKNRTIPVLAKCVVNGVPLIVQRAEFPRPDVAAAGFGVEHCGFSFDLLPALNALKPGEPLTLEVYAGHETLTKLGEWKSDWRAAFGIYGDVSRESAAKLSVLCLRMIAEASKPDPDLDPFFADSESGAAPSTPPADPICERLFAPTTIPTTLRVMAGGRSELPSAYLDYVRYRDRQDRANQPGVSSDAHEDFLRWFFAMYVSHRKWRRAPLSAQDIKFLNEPKTDRLVTRAMSHHVPPPHLEKNEGEDNPARRIDLAYWWAVELAPALYVEDCLVPSWCGEALRRVQYDWRQQPFHPNVFLTRYLAANEELKFLNLYRLGDRVLFYIYMLVQALSRPDLLLYMPREPLRRLIETRVTDADGVSRGLDDLIFRMLNISPCAFSLERLRKAARRRMFDIDEMRFLTRSPGGHRCFGAGLPRPAKENKADIQLIGPLRKASGLGQASRLSAGMIARGGFSYSAFDFGLDNPAPEGFSSKVALGGLKHARVNVIHLNAESIPLVYAYMPDVFSSSYNIGYFYWELDTPANCHYLALDLLDEIWVSSEYCRSIYASATHKPVVNVGMCAEHLDGISRAEARAYVSKRLGAAPDDFVFLSAFDSFSFIQRKNPVNVLRAFRAAFPDDRRVRLVLKTHNRHYVGDPQQLRMWRGIEEEIEGDPRITIIDETLSYEDLRKLKAGSDCFVSLHRSEGWGFGMIEAMASGIPVVATAYSGNMDFCTPETCWLVDYDLAYLYPEDYIFVIPGQRWADPRLDSAVAQLRAVAYDAEDRQRRVEAATRYVQANFSEEAISARYAARLKELLR
ncbi:MAG TPA: glycosyltransferase family 4 protein [Methylosinus sp.]|jgi:glycosyltransferase involved in cell wall biosynthesis